jgi:predicted nucleic acid-binding protein
LSEIEKVIGLDRKAVFEEFGRTRVETIFIHEKIDRQLVSKIIKETGLHRTDAVHVSIAFGNKINFIVTWNIRDFEKALVFVKCVSPNGFLDTL